MSLKLYDTPPTLMIFLGGSSDFCPLSIAAVLANVLKQDHYILEPDSDFGLKISL
jgi:hypothetical protein